MVTGVECYLMIILAALQEEIPTLHMEDHVIVTGLGKINAASQATRIILERKPSLIVNFGTAGALSDEIEHGLVECTGFIQHDMDCSPLGFEKRVTPFEEDGGMIGTSELVCGSGDSFLLEAGDLLDAGVHIVDMESYAIAKVCRRFNIPFRCFKYISDKADENAGNDWNSFQHSEAEAAFIEAINNL